MNKPAERGDLQPFSRLSHPPTLSVKTDENLLASGILARKMSIKVLLVEDEPRVQRFVKMGLEQAGMSVDCVSEIDEIEVSLQVHKFDVLVLDRLLHAHDTILILPRLRRLFPHQKIIILSALSEVEQRVEGLQRGADDYLGKPFHVEELVARIRNLARQSSSETVQASSNILEYKDLKVDLQSQRVFRNGSSIDLSAKEFRILATLMGAPTKVFSRAELLQKVWSMSFDPESNLVDVAVGRLKRKINLENLESLIHSKRGVGYSLITDETSA